MKFYPYLILAFLSFHTSVFSLKKRPNSYEFVKISDSPRIYECPSFLEESECDQIILEAKPSLERSTVIDVNSSRSVLDNRRTSLGTFIPHYDEISAIQKIRKVMEKITGIPRINGEGLQVLYYSVGAEYQPHYDYFDPIFPGGAIHLRRGGQRVATVLVYLNTPEKGGETVFPKANIHIKPKKGKAILFYNLDVQGNLDSNSLHGGAPVISGEKWIATLWLRENEFH